MERERIDQKRLQRPEAELGDERADSEVTRADEDQATGSEGAGRLIGLGETQDSRRKGSGEPKRLPD